MARGFLVVVFLALAFGCSQIRADFARHNALQMELDEYVIPKPLTEVWQSVVIPDGDHDTLVWSGASFTWTAAGRFKKKTSSNTSHDGGGGDERVYVTWFECHGLKAGKGSQVRYLQHTETTTTRNGVQITTDHSVERRPDLELELIERFDPSAAKRIRAEGERAAQTGEWYPDRKSSQ